MTKAAEYPKYDNVVGCCERLRRATKRGKFSRSAWEFDVVLNSRQKKIPKQRIIQIYHIVSIFTQFFAYVRQLKNVKMNMKNGHFIVH